MGSLDGRTALITGASRGLGRALALSFAREGAALALCGRRQAPLEEVAIACAAAGVRVVTVSADLGVARDVERVAATALDRLGEVDILVNNASDLGTVPLAHLGDASAEALQRALDVNVLGAFRMTRAVLGGMLLRGRGLVVNITSDAAVEGYPGWGVYGASKAALEGLTRSWAAELAGSGVRILAVDPGDMDTDMHRTAIPDADPAELRDPADVAEAILRLVVAGPGAVEATRLVAALS
jgi:NAD(P)-dependent dehydrogenase (short-subunit alcohol dehydrogenase family)